MKDFTQTIINALIGSDFVPTSEQGAKDIEKFLTATAMMTDDLPGIVAAMVTKGVNNNIFKEYTDDNDLQLLANAGMAGYVAAIMIACPEKHRDQFLGLLKYFLDNYDMGKIARALAEETMEVERNEGRAAPNAGIPQEIMDVIKQVTDQGIVKLTEKDDDDAE